MSYSDAYDANDGVAIIGLAGRFPGARNVDEFWNNLVDGRETLSFFADDELEPAAPDEMEARRQPNYVRSRGILADVEMFDAEFFGINATEAAVMDPQQRVFMETAWEALESAGHDPRTFAGGVGVFAGMSNNYYFLQNLLAREDVTDIVGWLTTMMGNEKDYLATRVSYKLDLKGPALNIQTACSTSLVAVCTAVQSLLNYQCDLALAGGVSITLPQKRGYLHQEGGITSPDGHCRTFDEDAAGTVFSNGVGIVTLRRLSEALEDGDTIYAVIKGAGMNNDGAAKVSFTAPSVEGHAGVIALAQALAGIDPESISYVEAHGTATQLGDPIEIAGLTQAFRAGGASETGTCAIGSVKSNVGHLDAAAGVTGLIKTALALHHKAIPPSLHFTAPNPKLDLEATPFRVVTSLQPWQSPEGSPRRAGVSSFGVGGTNAHVVLEEAPVASASGADDDEQLHRPLGPVGVGPRRRHVEPARPSRRPPGGPARRCGLHAPNGPAAVLAPPGRRGQREPTTPSSGSARWIPPRRSPAPAPSTKPRSRSCSRDRGRSPWGWRARCTTRIPASAPISTSARRSCALNSASTYATCSIPSRAAKSWRSSGSDRRR